MARAYAALEQTEVQPGHRAVATRYDKGNFVFCGTTDVASIRIWLRDPIP